MGLFSPSKSSPALTRAKEREREKKTRGQRVTGKRDVESSNKKKQNKKRERKREKNNNKSWRIRSPRPPTTAASRLWLSVSLLLSSPREQTVSETS